jgi:AraC family transcriptional regulator, ethanolamine operon transcriptional activator
MVSASIGYPQSARSQHAGASAVWPGVTIDNFRDPTTPEDEIEVLNQNLVQLRSDPLHARRVVVPLKSTVVIYQSTNLAVRGHANFSQGLIGFVAFGPQAAGTINGLLIRPNLILMAAAGVEGRFVVEAGYESIAVGIPPASFEEHLKIRKQWDRLQPNNDLELLVCDAKKARALFSFGHRLAFTATKFPSLFDEEDVRAAAEAELVESLLGAISSSENYTITRSDETHQTHSEVVKLAEEYVLTHNNIPLHVTDLCRAAAVSERTLEYAFKEVLGMSPVSYLRRFRLHRVRHALRTAVSGQTTVSAEALKWGFWHFGEFSKAYKNCFGELPSDTLRRQPSERRRVKK